MARDEELPITAGQDTLAATLTLPDQPPAAGEEPAPATRWPAALLLPSYLPRDRDGELDRVGHPGWFADRDSDAPPGILARLAGALARRGVASLRYDKRGCGRSDGTWETAGAFTLVDDARDAVAALRGSDAIDAARVGIVGHGEGGWLALSVAAADPGVGPLTLIGAPARGLRDVLRRAVAERSRRLGDPAPSFAPAPGPTPAHPFVAALDRGLEELLERAERGEPTIRLSIASGERIELGLGAWEQAMQIPARALATLQQRSVTVVHGGADGWVDPDESILLTSALEATATPRRIVVPGAGHDLAAAPPELFRDLAADLAARLQARRLPTVLLSIGLR
jgi:uncharacterized protein